MITEVYRPLFVCFTIQLSYYSRSVVFSTLILIMCAAVGFKHPEENSIVLEACVFLINYLIGLVCLVLYCVLHLHLTIDKLWHYEFEVLSWMFKRRASNEKDPTYFSFVYAFLIFVVTFLTTEALHFGSGGIVWKASCINAVLLIQTVAWLFELFSDDPNRRTSGFRVPALEHLLLGILFCNILMIDIFLSQPISRSALYICIVGVFMLVQFLLNAFFKPPASIRRPASTLL